MWNILEEDEFDHAVSQPFFIFCDMTNAAFAKSCLLKGVEI